LSSSNLLKGFGVGADVTGQLATDKALRRKATGNVLANTALDALGNRINVFESDSVTGVYGEVIEMTTTGDPELGIEHGLGRVPVGVIVLLGVGLGTRCIAFDATTFDMAGNAGAIKVWVV
jgi:hypothetical protein